MRPVISQQGVFYQMGVFMRKKKTPELPPKEETRKYICSWCGKELPENKFFQCSLKKNIHICSSCIKGKYNELVGQYEKMIAILVCCHYLDIGFNYDLFKSLKPDCGFGDYLRMLNLLQNQNPDNFEQGLLKSGIIQPTSDYVDNMSLKQELSAVVGELERIRNSI